MHALLFILRRTTINHLKELKRKPGKLAIYSLLIIFVAAVLLISFFNRNQSIPHGSVESFGLLASIYILVVTFFSVNNGISKGGSFFRMADVNLVFTAPISSRKVLIYGFIKQLAVTLLSLFFLTIQSGNLQNTYGLDTHGFLIVWLGAFLLMLHLQLISMFIYSLTSQSTRIKQLFMRFWNGIGIVVLVLYIGQLLEKKDALKSAYALLNSGFFNNIPFIGWYKALIVSSLTKEQHTFLLNLSFILLLFAIMCIIFYKMKPDYYEEVLAQTEHKEDLYARRKSGKIAGTTAFQFKLRKVKQTYSGQGAKAIFYRHMLEYKKAGFFFITRSSFIMAALGFASGYTPLKGNMIPLLFISLYVLFIMQIQGKWLQELDKPYIYLIPAGSASKVIYATLAETFKSGVDGFIMFAVAGLMGWVNLVLIFCCALCYMTWSLLFTFTDILVRRLLGPDHSKVFQIMIRMLLYIVVVIPGIIISFAVIPADQASHMSFFIILLACNAAVAMAILQYSKGIFDKLEMK